MVHAHTHTHTPLAVFLAGSRWIFTSHHEAGIDIRVLLSPSISYHRDGGRGVMVWGGQNYNFILSTTKRWASVKYKHKNQTDVLFCDGKTPGLVSQRGKLYKTTEDSAGSNVSPLQRRAHVKHKRETNVHDEWKNTVIMPFYADCKKSNLGLHCKGWKFKVGILWKIPLQTRQREPSLCSGTPAQVLCQCLVPATNQQASAVKCQCLINPLGGPGAKLNCVPLQRPPRAWSLGQKPTLTGWSTRLVCWRRYSIVIFFFNFVSAELNSQTTLLV